MLELVRPQADLGDTKAKRIEALNKTATKMNPTQIAEAQHLAKEWQPK